MHRPVFTAALLYIHYYIYAAGCLYWLNKSSASENGVMYIAVVPVMYIGTLKFIMQTV